MSLVSLGDVNSIINKDGFMYFLSKHSYRVVDQFDEDPSLIPDAYFRDVSKIKWKEGSVDLLKKGSFFGFQLPWNSWTSAFLLVTLNHIYFFTSNQPSSKSEFSTSLKDCIFQDESNNLKKPNTFSLRTKDSQPIVINTPTARVFFEWKVAVFQGRPEFREELKKFIVNESILIQKIFRGYRERRKLAKMISASIVIQKHYKGYIAAMTLRRKKKAVVVMQSFCRMVVAKTLLRRLRIAANISKYHGYRTNIVKELLSTEESYINDMDIVIKYYMAPLNKLVGETDEKVTGIVQSDINKLFSNIQEIHDLHKKFLTEIQKVVDSWEVNRIVSSLFDGLLSWMTVYSTYYNNYELSIESFEKIKKVDVYKKVLEAAWNNPGVKKIELSGYLVVPVQRPPRYELLVKDLLKHTWTEHPDQKNLGRILDSLREKIVSLNEAKRKSNTKRKLKVLQARFKQPEELEAVLGEGDFIMEGSAVCTEDNKTTYKAYLVLFDDQLVISKRTTDLKKGGGSMINYKKTYRFSGAKSVFLLSITDKAQIEEGLSPFGFKVTTAEQSFKFAIKNKQEQSQWIREINKATESMKNRPKSPTK